MHMVVYQRGRYRAEKIIVRRTPELEIIFLNKETICVFPKHGSGTQFHRWFAPRDSYEKGWKDFRDSLMRYKNLTYLRCFELAAKYEIQSVSARGHPELDESQVKEIN